LKKSAQKTFAGGLGTSGVFNRPRWGRLKTPEVPSPPAKVFLVTFFSKKVTSSFSRLFRRCKQPLLQWRHISVINNRKVPGIRALLANLGHNGPSGAQITTRAGRPPHEIKDR
jgi:hypothetical protein